MYYDSNAIYQYIRSKEIDNLKFASGDVWQLVYGDNNCIPKLLVVVTAVGRDPHVTKMEKIASQILKKISDKAEIPLLSIRFDSQEKIVEKVKIYTGEQLKYQELNLKSLKEIFKQYGLPVNSGQTGKYLNDAASSAYHKWQRNELGKDMKVSDFDLWKVNNKGEPVTLFELKRSIISIDKWEPYEDDYNNFRLLFNVLKKTGIDFKILYNVRSKKPVINDDISKIKIFNVDFSRDTEQIIFQEIKSKDDFFLEKNQEDDR